MLSKDLDRLIFGTKGIFLHSGCGVYIIKFSVKNEKICVFNKHHIIFRRHSDLPWNIVCSVEVGLNKHGYGNMPPKKAYVLVFGMFHKVHCMSTCTKFEGETHRW